jgi:uridine monophosphate synthetase
MSFFSFLENRVKEIDSLLCVGLDPHPSDLPEQTGEAAKAFCLRIIKQTADLAAAFKPNSAFFEALGPEGMTALREVIQEIPGGIPVILDVKRSDIASTAKAYVTACFDILGADAVTLNPYLGRDAVEPFLEDPEKGVFLLCKTSNPGASDLQDVRILTQEGIKEERPHFLYEHVASLAQSWNQSENLGLVVGATQVDSLKAVQSQAPDLWILAPGIGAQGGDLQAAVRAGIREDGLGLLVPVSRGISRADQPRQAAAAIRDSIRREIQTVRTEPAARKSSLEEDFAPLAKALLRAGCVKFGEFTLKSGLQSPIYIDLRILTGKPRLLKEVASAYLPILRNLEFDCLAALPYAALPITTAISLLGDWPMVYPRKEEKAYGTRASVEGEYTPGDRVVVIDDLITTGGSKLEGIEKLSSVGLEVKDIVVLIDRQSGGRDNLNRHGFQLHTVFTLSEMLAYYERNRLVEENKIAQIRSFLEAEGT